MQAGRQLDLLDGRAPVFIVGLEQRHGGHGRVRSASLSNHSKLDTPPPRSRPSPRLRTDRRRFLLTIRPRANNSGLLHTGEGFGFDGPGKGKDFFGAFMPSQAGDVWHLHVLTRDLALPARAAVLFAMVCSKPFICMAASNTLGLPGLRAIRRGLIPVLVGVFLLMARGSARAMPRRAGTIWSWFRSRATINQNAIMRQEISRPPMTAAHAPGAARRAIAGVPPEKLAGTRFTLSAVDFEGPADIRLDPAIFASAWRGLIGKEVSLHQVGTVLESAHRGHLSPARTTSSSPRSRHRDFASGRLRIVAYTGLCPRVRGEERHRPVARAARSDLRPHPGRCGRCAETAIYRQLLIRRGSAGRRDHCRLVPDRDRARSGPPRDHDHLSGRAASCSALDN